LDHFIAKNATAHKVNSYYTRYFLLHILCRKTHYFRPWHCNLRFVGDADWC